MKPYYCGIDLSAKTSQVCVIDDDHRKVVNEKLGNDITAIDARLTPYKESLRIVVEGTFNWYWLVDGLKARGYDVTLAHTLGLYMITGAKVKTDKRDALALAKLMLAKMIPPAYIYPPGERAKRDLVRRRMRVVQLRAAEYASMRRMLYRHGIIEHTRHEMKKMTEDEIASWFTDERVQLTGEQTLERIRLYTRQIEEMEHRMRVEIRGEDAYRRLMGLPGVDRILALTIYYESGDIARFGKAKHYSSYCRVVPGISQSGNVVRRGRNPNQGNHYLKWAYNQAASYAVRYYEPVRAYFDRILKTHHGRARKLIAYNAVAHKLAVAGYRIMRFGDEYRQDLLFGAATPGA